MPNVPTPGHKLLAQMRAKIICGSRHGAVEITTHDGRIVQIERRAKLRTPAVLIADIPCGRPARKYRLISAFVAVVAAASCSAAASAATPAELEHEVQELKVRIAHLEALITTPHASAVVSAATVAAAPAPAALEQKVRVIERRLEVKDEESTAHRLKTPLVSLSDKGLAITTPDQNFELRARGYVQIDTREWLGNNAPDATITFLFRRVRPVVEGTVYHDFYYKLMPDFAGSAVTLQDGYAEWRRYPFARVAAGKFKSPVGLERLESASELAWVERGLTNNLIPNRDFGVQVSGDLLGERLNYAIGIFNGVPDLGSSGASDTNDDKDFAGRVFAFPFKDWYGPLQGLGVGVSGTYGKEQFTTSANVVTSNLATYLTPGQSRFFRYRTTGASATVKTADGKSTIAITVSNALDSTTVADGDRHRIAPQAYWYWRQFGLLGDYVESAQEVAFGSHRDILTQKAWSIAGSWVLTGEAASYRSVRPRHNFDPLQRSWGALELVARYGELEIDPSAFDGIKSATNLGTAFADPRQSARAAFAWGLGLNWYLNNNFKVNFDYEHTTFTGGGGGTALAPLDRTAERVLMSRFQIAY